MTVDNIQVQEPKIPEKPPTTVQNGIQKEMLKESLMGTSSMQNQMLQLLASAQPLQSIQDTAQKQIEKGYLDIKV